jgi:hypothetical protein
MLGVTKGISTWNTQNNNVERLMDNSAYTSAHPDDTLVLAGPPRFSNVDLSENATTSAWRTLLAIGMLQTFQISSQKPTQPMQAIGSGRAFFVSGKSMTTWRIGRLLTNGRNLLRVLYHNAVAGGVQVENFDDPVVPQNSPGSSSTLFFCNLDSELFYVPFGLGVLFKDKTSQALGSFYVELAMISTYTIGFTSGQNMVLEDVGGMCDRLVPFYTSTMVTGGGVHVPRSSMDLVIGFTGGVTDTGVLAGDDDWNNGFGD